MDRKIVSKTGEFFGNKLTLETGRLAKQADLSVLATLGETCVLATVVSKPKSEDPGFLPLTIDYEEKLYAGGIIKSSKWIKREGRPTDANILVARLIDHCVRPLFPKDFRDEVQLIITVMSVDDTNSPEVAAMLAASAVLAASSLPFKSAFATLQIGRVDKNILYNPSRADMKNSDIDLFISYLKGEKVQAMEGSFNLVSDEDVKSLIKNSYEKALPLITFIEEFAKEVGIEKREYTSFKPNADIHKQVSDLVLEDIIKLTNEKKGKLENQKNLLSIKEKLIKQLEEKYTKEELNLSEIEASFDRVYNEVLRNLVLVDNARCDGRKMDEVRPINCEIGILPRVHGSALFERGLTQALSVVTLDSPANTQVIETLHGEEEMHYFHHYVGLAFSTGEVGRVGNPGRREIGHGFLAQKALIPVLPSTQDFPYVIRVVSEVLSQNGSSSMASTCGSTLSLMDAGVPIKDIVGGVSIGLVISEKEDNYKILTDIQGVEDFSGFMDFKMTGTTQAVTAIQMDIKLAGIPLKLFDEILEASKNGRLFIIEKMRECMPSARDGVKEYAPKIKRVRIEKDEIGLVIGSGGKTIKDIEKRTGAKLDIMEEEASAYVVLSSPSLESIKKAEDIIENLFKKPDVGEIYDGVVTKLFTFGALVEFLPGKEGLVHISEIKEGYVEKVEDFLKEGQNVKVKLKAVTDDGKNVLTLKF
ncbi:polyribonucleotide nucleotidyltransferase [Patescibacteria group bacterium]|nr:polyribonucleotide nucleotidyltransferase [Patescibacteria group bacterium]